MLLFNIELLAIQRSFLPVIHHLFISRSARAHFACHFAVDRAHSRTRFGLLNSSETVS